MEFSFLSMVNKITELLWLLFSDFSQNCFPPLPFSYMSVARCQAKERSFHYITYKTPRAGMADPLHAFHVGCQVTGQLAPWATTLKEIRSLHLLFYSAAITIPTPLNNQAAFWVFFFLQSHLGYAPECFGRHKRPNLGRATTTSIVRVRQNAKWKNV